MKKLFAILFAMLSIMVIRPLGGVEEVSDACKQFEKILSLPWKTSGKHSLPDSHTTFNLPNDYFLLSGQDARKANNIMGFSSDSEAIVLNLFNKNMNIIEFLYDDGIYIRLNNLSRLEHEDLFERNKKIIETVSKSTKEQDEPLQLLAWRDEPTLDLLTKTLYYSFIFSFLVISGSLIGILLSVP